jgi:FkbM family methyltransferase
MNRRIESKLFLGIANNAKYIPSIIWNVKNWPTYFLYYLGVKKGGGVFVLRNGAVIRDKEGTASGTIAVVFIRKHYGSIVGKGTVVEIGANIGIFAIYAAATESNARLYCYEPIRANYDVLVRNTADNGYQDRITAFNLGVASKTGKRQFYLGSSPEHSLFRDNTSDQTDESVTVDCVSLSEILSSNAISNVDLLKINAEGAEYEILYSTPKECFDKINEIRMEYHKQSAEKDNLECLKSFLEGMGYSATYLYEHKDSEGFLWMKKTHLSYCSEPITLDLGNLPRPFRLQRDDKG